MKRIIAMLPNGEWGIVTGSSPVLFYEFDTDAEYNKFLADKSLADARFLGRASVRQRASIEIVRGEDN